MTFIEKMREAAKQLEAPPPDPWRKPLEQALKGVDAMSTVALLDLVGARQTTQNGRPSGGDHAGPEIHSDPVPAPDARRLPRHRHTRLGASIARLWEGA